LRFPVSFLFCHLFYYNYFKPFVYFRYRSYGGAAEVTALSLSSHLNNQSRRRISLRKKIVLTKDTSC